MKKDTTQPPTEKPMEKIKEAVEAGILPGKKDHLEEEVNIAILPGKNGHSLLSEDKVANIIIFEDGYVTVAINPAGRKAVQIGDRVKNAIKAMLKEGYAVKIQTIKQTELPF